MSLLFEVGDEELGDGGIVIDEEELDSIAGKDFHIWLRYNYYNDYKH
jgi:hypothetical protein